MTDTRAQNYSSPPAHWAESRRGVACGLGAYVCWGFFPLFFMQLAGVPALQVLAHRICWSLLTLMIVLTVWGDWGHFAAIIRNRKQLLLLAATTLLISTNWFVFILAVDHREVLQSSFGYFINPLVSVLLGVVFLHERLRLPQLLSLCLAVAGVLVMTISQGALPWTALILAFSFGVYGLLRKIVDVDSVTGLFVETLLLFPAAVAYILFLAGEGRGAFAAGSAGTTALLCSSGIVTAVPLVLFAASVRRLRLATVGFLQYITPTLHFMLAVSVFGERVNYLHLGSFLCIWAGLALYMWDLMANNPASVRDT